MILSHRSDTHFVFELDVAEAEAFRWILAQYPVDPEGAFEVSRGLDGATMESASETLSLSMADRRHQLRSAVDVFLKDSERFRGDESEAVRQLTVGVEEVEWMLQVLNETRVSAWRRLGSPEDFDEVERDEDASLGFLMEVAAFFQTALIYAWSPDSWDDEDDAPGDDPAL